MRLYFVSDLVIIDIVINSLLEDPSFDHCGHVVVPFLIDCLRLDEIDKVFLGDHLDLREVGRFAGLAWAFEGFMRLVILVLR